MLLSIISRNFSSPLYMSISVFIVFVQIIIIFFPFYVALNVNCKLSRIMLLKAPFSQELSHIYRDIRFIILPQRVYENNNSEMSKNQVIINTEKCDTGTSLRFTKRCLWCILNKDKKSTVLGRVKWRKISCMRYWNLSEKHTN